MTPARRSWLIELACVVGLLLAAAALRFYRLQDYPAGYHNDEVAIAHAVETVMAGRRAIFFPEDTGHEALYMYFSAPFGAVLGHTVFAFRLPSAFLGMLALCAVWALARRMLGPLPAGATLAAMGVTWWGVLWSRVTLHVIAVVPTLALAMYFFWRAWYRASSEEHRQKAHLSLLASRTALYFALSGLFLALAFNSYTAARVTPILLVALVGYLAILQRDMIRQHWRGLLTLVVVALVLSAPLIFYLLTHPGAKQLRYSGFSADQPLADLLSGKPQLAVETTLQTLGMFAITGDSLPALNIPGRPMFEPIGMLLFLIGAGVLLWRWRDPRYGFVLIGLLVTLLPGMLSLPAPSYAHTVGAMVFAFIVLGIGVGEVWRWTTVYWGSVARYVGVVALVVVLGGNLARTTHDFFAVWPAQPATRWWMQTGLKEIARALNADRRASAIAERSDPIAICVPSWLIDEHLEWWRPAWWVWHYLSPRNERDVRWYDCAEAVVVPGGDAPRFGFPDVTSLDQLGNLPIARWMQAASKIEQVGGSMIVRADVMPAWSAEVARLAGRLSSDTDLPAVTWPPEIAQGQPAALPVDYDHALQLTAYDVQGRATPGAAITVTTYWRVVAPLQPRLALFTHVVTGTSIVAQADHFGITSQNLRPGDVFLQTHVIKLPEDVERGWYEISVGVYSQDTGARLPVYDGAAQMGDRIFLQLLRVWRR